MRPRKHEFEKIAVNDLAADHPLCVVKESDMIHLVIDRRRRNDEKVQVKKTEREEEKNDVRASPGKAEKRCSIYLESRSHICN